MTARTFFWKKTYVLSDLILGIECPYGPVEKMAFFDASGLYALNPQQEALNCIIFIFSDL